MFIRSLNRNMTGKAQVFIFSFPSLPLFFPSPPPPPPPPPLLRSSLSLFIPPSPPPLLFACLPHPHRTSLKDEISLRAAPADIIFSMLNLAYPSSLLLFIFGYPGIVSAKYAVSSDWCTKGYFIVIHPEGFQFPHFQRHPAVTSVFPHERYKGCVLM